MTEVLHQNHNAHPQAYPTQETCLPGEAFPRASSFLDRMRNMPKAAETHNGDEMIGDYIIGDKLGQGSFGKVMCGTHISTKQKVALKFIDYSKIKSQKERENIKREERFMQLLDHPNIVKLIEVLEPKDTTCLVLEHVAGGELFDYIVSHRRLKEPEAIRFLRQIIQGLEYIHSNLIIHRDLKPENLLLDANNNIKINDFGLSNVMSPGNFLTTYCGSPLYSSPEIILETSYIGPEVDVWALGVIIYAMVTGYLPWDGDTLKQQVYNAVRASYEVPAHVSPECKDLIARCLCIDPKKRATVQELRMHPFLSKGYATPPPSCLPAKREIKELDMDILDKMADMGFDKSAVAADLFANRNTKQTFVLYFLMLDKKAKEEADQARLEEAAMKKAAITPKKSYGLAAIPEDSAAHSSPPASPIVSLRPSTGTVGRKNNRHSWGPVSKDQVPPSIPASIAALAQSQPLPTGNGNSNTLPPSFNIGIASNLATNNTVSAVASPKSSRKMGGFLKLFSKKDKHEPASEHASPISEEPVPATRQRRATIDLGESPVPQFQADLDKQLRVSKGAFTVETTTMKPFIQIKEEIERVLKVLNMTYKHTKKGVGYSCKAPDSSVEVDIEICKIDKLEGIKGIKLKRASGDVWQYKVVYQRIIGELHL